MLTLRCSAAAWNTRKSIACFSSLTDNQKRYMELLKKPEVSIVICTGPAGSGKTMVSCHYALQSMKEKLYEKLVVTRPAVGAGENLGYLPGTLENKIEPYMRPITDFLGNNRRAELCPVSFLRGRTFDNSLILVDEAQNCTIQQMKMVLTRIGRNSKMVVSGDIRQSDLENTQESGLSHLVCMLKQMPKVPKTIRLVELEDGDVKRSHAVRDVIHMYDASGQ